MGGGVARRGGGENEKNKDKAQRETETERPETDRGTQLVLREGCYLEYLAIDGLYFVPKNIASATNKYYHLHTNRAKRLEVLATLFFH